MTRLSGPTLFKAVAETDEIMKRAQPAGPFMLRAPYRAWNGRVADELNRSDMKKYVGSIFWDVGGALTSAAGADWDCWGRGVTVERCAALYLQEIRTKKRGRAGLGNGDEPGLRPHILFELPIACGAATTAARGGHGSPIR